MANIVSNSRIVTASRIPEPIYKYLGIAYRGFGEGTNLWPSNPFQTSNERNDLFGDGYRGLGTWTWTEAGSYTSALNNATVNALWTSGKSFTIETMVYQTIGAYYGIGFGTSGYSSGGMYHEQWNSKCVLNSNYGTSSVQGSLRLVVNGSTIYSDSTYRYKPYGKYLHLVLTYDHTTSTYCIFVDGHKIAEVVDTSSHTSAKFGNYLPDACTQLAVYDYVAYKNDFDISFTVPHIRNPMYGLKTV